jgi:hypothetical protein
MRLVKMGFGPIRQMMEKSYVKLILPAFLLQKGGQNFANGLCCIR